MWNIQQETTDKTVEKAAKKEAKKAQRAEKMAAKHSKMIEARLSLSAARAGFNYKDGRLRATSTSLLDLMEKWTDKQAGLDTSIAVQGAHAQVLDGDSRKQSIGSTALGVALFGPLGLVGSGKEIAVMVTAQDGTQLVSTTKK